MNAPGNTSVPSMNYKAGIANSGNIYSYMASIKYQTSFCPTGLTVNGSNIYHSDQ